MKSNGVWDTPVGCEPIRIDKDVTIERLSLNPQIEFITQKILSMNEHILSTNQHILEMNSKILDAFAPPKFIMKEKSK